MSLIEELRWRGLLQDFTEGTDKKITDDKMTVYSGFDPTSDSLQLGNFAAIVLLMHFERAGHNPVALVGGATGMIGDPSGKSKERNLLSEEEIRRNEASIKRQLEKFLDFEGDNRAVLVNNYDWIGDMKLIPFMRDVAKNITVSSMLSKESVKQRMEAGLSFTEFTYQLIQGYDFYHLYKKIGCNLQVGGSDQWGNITVGTELIRRMDGGEAYGLVCPLITDAEGRKFGKSATGEKIWLDPGKTSPYKFYQFWMNRSDTDALKLLKLFTFLEREEIDEIEREHSKAPHERLMQKRLAKELTEMVHSRDDFRDAVNASSILFGNGGEDELRKLSVKQFLSVFEGVPWYKISIKKLSDGMNVVSLFKEAGVCGSKGEAKRLVKNGGIRINRERITDGETTVNRENLINGRFLLAQTGKKKYSVIEADQE